MYTVATLGMICRLLAVILAIWSIYLIWRANTNSLSIKKFLATSIGLESVYFASLIPSILYLFALGWTHDSVFFSILGFGYFLHVILTVPFLAILAIKLFKNKSGLDNFRSFNFIAITFLGYVTALWANAVFRWIGTALTEGMSFLWVESTSVLAWNAIILMTLSVVFASVGAFYVIKKKRRASKWVGLSLTMVGLHYLVFLIYHFFIGALISVWLIDVWAIALLGLGISLIRSNISLDTRH